MTDLRTISPDELPPLSEIPEDLRAVVFSPNGPLQSLPYEKLLTKLIAANLAKATKSALDADLAHDADAVALVFDDPDVVLNGWYRKLGANGVGTWVQFEELSRNARILAQTAAASAIEKLAEVNAAGDAKIAQAIIEANRAEAAANAIQAQRWALPAHSAQFPNFNRQYAGLAGHIAYPLTNLVASPLLRHDTAGAFFIMLQVPHERTNQNARYRVLGNTTSASPSSGFSLTHFGDDHITTTSHDEFQWVSRGNAGDTLNLAIDVQERAAIPQLIVVRCDGAGGFSIASYAAGLPKIAGGTQSSSSHSINVLSGTSLLVGDQGTAGGDLSVLTLPAAAFTGAIAFHGFVRGDAGDDTKWQAIAEGADIQATLTGATSFALARDYRSGGSGLADRLSAFAPGDTTLAGTIHGTVQPGGHIVRQSAAEWITFDRLPDGYVICPADGAQAGQIRLRGASTGVSGDVLMRVVSDRGDVLVPPFRLAAVAASMDLLASVPSYRGWGFFEWWATSHPNRIHRMNARIGCGDKAAVIGQSQVDNAIYSQFVPQQPTGLVSFCAWQGARSDPADTTSSPVARFSTSARPQLFVIEPQMTSVYNGVQAMARRIAEHNNGGAICIVDRAINGTSARDWIDDTVTARLWAQDEEMAQVAGRDLTPVWQWYTADPANYPDVLNAVVRGAGPLNKDHFFGDGTIQLGGYKLAISLPSRATVTSAGPTDSDTFGTNRTAAQAGQIAFANAYPQLAVLGPATTDVAIDNAVTSTGTNIAPNVANANLGGPHLSIVIPEGCDRLLYRMGEAYLRARGKSPCPNNSFLDGTALTINGGRTIITVPARLRNQFGRLRTDNNMFRFDSQPAAGDTVTIDGHVITFVAGGAAGQQVNIGADAAATALALRTYVVGSLAATHTAFHWNRMVMVFARRRGMRPVIACTGSAILLPGAAIEGFEISENGGITWSRTGFTAAIVDNETVRLTKTSGSWPANVLVRAYAGGPFSYGTADELNARYKGHLYDGCEAENGLGFPLLGFESVIIA